MSEPHIWCPKCRWRPRAGDRWVCLPGCGTSWNTFWTGGVCPGCAHHWHVTQCIACHAVSPHRDWYHWPDGKGAEVVRHYGVRKRNAAPADNQAQHDRSNMTPTDAH